ncbi:MAG: hypothetical protein ACR2OU_13540 [Thermomicrobiales bacterium]
MRSYERIEPALCDEYQMRLKPVTGLDAAMFVQGLRNYMLHYRLPSTGHQMSFANDPRDLSYSVTLNCNKLRDWSRWKPQVISYLDRRENVNILQAVEEYTRTIEELYRWLFSQGNGVAMKTAQRKLEVQSQITMLKGNHDVQR